MKTFAIYILISFAAITVFGFSGLIDHESLFSQCVNATIPGGMPCANNSHDLGMSILHAKIFQSFSNAVMILGLLLSLGLAAVALTDSLKKISTAQIAIKNTFASASESRLKYGFWLKLNQQHPNHVI